MLPPVQCGNMLSVDPLSPSPSLLCPLCVSMLCRRLPGCTGRPFDEVQPQGWWAGPILRGAFLHSPISKGSACV
jgi:hypothetical protein